MSASLMPTYAPAPISPVRGDGMWLYDENGTEWLDCIGGIATNALGHCHPHLVRALTRQAGRLWHTSNAITIPQQAEVATMLTRLSFAQRVFFANSGTEAVEAALKLARGHHAAAGRPQRVDVIAFHGAFHGRTYAALNAAGNQAYMRGFGPPLPGYVHLALNDVEGLEIAAARPTTAAIIVEPVQGEGGARTLNGDDLLRLREVADRNKILLIHDEVQSGMGRTGKLFAHQWKIGAEPDIMAIAKALGGGFPIGACLATERASSGFTAGSHGSTFGGNPLAMAVAKATLEIVADETTLANVRARSMSLRDRLERLRASHPLIIGEIRGKGLLVGVRLLVPNRDFIAAARSHRLLLAAGGDNIVRLLPSLLITEAEVDEVASRFAAVCQSWTEHDPEDAA